MYVMSTSGEGAEYLSGSSPPLPPSPAPPCLPCVEGRQRAAPHSSSFPPDDCSFAYAPHGRVGPSPRP
ncbi:unnamed protein product, partial [Closterium sp. NIES-64]